MWASLSASPISKNGSRVPQSVLSVGNGVPSVDACFSLPYKLGRSDDHLHVLVADVAKSLETVERSILGCTGSSWAAWVVSPCLLFVSCAGPVEVSASWWFRAALNFKQVRRLKGGVRPSGFRV